MRLETKNLLENSRKSCYLECGRFIWSRCKVAGPWGLAGGFTLRVGGLARKLIHKPNN